MGSILQWELLCGQPHIVEVGILSADLKYAFIDCVVDQRDQLLQCFVVLLQSRNKILSLVNVVVLVIFNFCPQLLRLLLNCLNSLRVALGFFQLIFEGFDLLLLADDLFCEVLLVVVNLGL